MGITITSIAVRAALDGERSSERRDRLRAEGRLRSGPNPLAWFLDGLVQRLDPSLPRHIFSQAVAPPSGPGDLDQSACLQLAAALERARAEDVLACYAPADGDDPAPGLALARELARLVRRCASDGGMTVL